jgi:hypothetical protein
MVSRIHGEISFNQQDVHKSVFSSLCINNGFSHFLTFVPAWQIDDGFFEIEIAKRNMAEQFIHNFNRLIMHHRPGVWNSGIETFTCEFDRPELLMGDGELFEDIKRVNVHLEKKKLKFWMRVFERR